MYNGLAKRMADYAKSPHAEQKRLGELFQRASNRRTAQHANLPLITEH